MNSDCNRLLLWKSQSLTTREFWAAQQMFRCFDVIRSKSKIGLWSIDHSTFFDRRVIYLVIYLSCLSQFIKLYLGYHIEKNAPGTRPHGWWGRGYIPSQKNRIYSTHLTKTPFSTIMKIPASLWKEKGVCS